jgi:protein-S-isoprenylcysteine O-methyltransferase Ste14
VFLKEPSLLGGFLAVLATGLLLITARRDEAECLQTFGAAYAEYMRRTRMFIPLIF